MTERWIPSGHGFQVVTEDGMHAICLVKDTGDADSQFKRACLLAAAPELLDVLEQCRQLLDNLQGRQLLLSAEHGGHFTIDNRYELALADLAIAKARGNRGAA
jgi:hypothetical protein